MLQRHRALFTDLLFSLLLAAAVLLYASSFVNFDIPPFEDAAMLMRYADHLAHGYGIVWNIGEPPVDGATDFLFMAAAAGLIKIGFPIGRAVRTLGFVSHLLTVILVYWVNRRMWRADIPLSFLSGLYLAVGTGLSYVAAFFGAPFFALFAALTWTLGLLLIRAENPSFWLSMLFALTGLLTALIRPEGAILAALMLVGVIIMKGPRPSAKSAAAFLGVFLILGGAYFLWRWQYFGYPLPTPFYKKSAGVLHWDSFKASFENGFRLCGPFLFAYLLGFRSPNTTRQTIAFLVPLVGFAGAFILISDEMNFGARFQYPLVPIVLLSWFPLVRGLGEEIGLSWSRLALGLPAPRRSVEGPARVRGRSVWMLAALALGFVVVRYSASQNCVLTSYQQSCASAYAADGRYDVGQMLADYRDRGYVIATTEAGLLPLYSHWAAVDAWGLNDAWIAHNGEVTEEYLDRYKPQLIVFHAYFSPLVPPKLTDKNLSQDWFRTTIILKDYAEQRGYILAAVFGDSPYDTHYYYVRPDFPEAQKIAAEIRGMQKYYWFMTGKKAINYASFQQP